jgi:hypothetical protein
MGPLITILALQMARRGASVALATVVGAGVGFNFGWFLHAIAKRNTEGPN